MLEMRTLRPRQRQMVACSLILVLAFACGPSRVIAPNTSTPQPSLASTPGSGPTGTSAPSYVRAMAVAVASRDLALVGGEGVIERTSDGGRSWTRTYDGPATIWMLHWRDAQSAYAASDAGLLVSEDAGQRWSATAALPLLDAVMLSSTHGFAVSGGVRRGQGWLPLNLAIAGTRLVQTTDGGKTWAAVDASLPVVQSVFFLNDRSGWVAGPDGVAVTRDGGASWTPQVRFPATLYRGGGIATADPNRGAQTIFDDELHGFTLVRTGDTSLSKSGKDVYYTSDGGAHWTLATTTAVPRPGAENAAINGGGGADGPLVLLPRGMAGYVSAQVATTGTSFYTTQDGGRTWTSVVLPFSGNGFGQTATDGGGSVWIALADAHLGVAHVANVILQSADGGRTWKVLR